MKQKPFIVRLIGLILLIFGIIHLNYIYSYEDAFTGVMLSVVMFSTGGTLLGGFTFWKFLLDILAATSENNASDKSEHKEEVELKLEYLVYLENWKANHEAFNRQQSNPKLAKTVKQTTQTPDSYEMWRMNKRLR